MSKQPVSRRDLLKAGGALAGAYLAPLTDARGSHVDITLEDRLRHPKFSWPVSRLSYPLDLGRGAPEGNLRLLDREANKPVPFQLTDVRREAELVRRATLHFLADLPSGARRDLRLMTAAENAAPAAPDVAAVRVSRDTRGITLDNGLVRVQIPPGGKAGGAPILRLGNGRQWLGRGELAVSGPVSVTAEETAVGPVFAEYRLTYRFSGGRWYQATIRLTARMEFVELDERMQGFAKSENAAWRLVWDGLDITHRYCPNRAPEPVGGTGGDPSAARHPDLPYDQQPGPDGRLPLKIAPYHNWISWWHLPTAAFWDEKGDTRIGVFLTDMARWNDGEYALWGSSDILSVHFHYINERLSWRLPLVQGTRSLALAAYPHERDAARVRADKLTPLYVDDLRRWHGWIPLQKVKDWVLDFPATPEAYPRFFERSPGDAGEIERRVQRSGMIASLPDGTERGGGPNPVGSREFYHAWTPDWDRVGATVPAEQARRLQAAYAFLAYLHRDEALMPLRTMLAGHPNFLADVKGVPGMAAFLFPQHPEARRMADHFEKSVELNLRYHTRPDVPAWGAQGGRWTENLACYVWAALQPIIQTSYLLHHHFDGRNRLLQPGIASLARWLLNCASAPQQRAAGRRTLPPQGAHARQTHLPYLLRVLGQELMRFDPLLGEHLLWLVPADNDGFESKGDKEDDPYRKMLAGWENNGGTGPRLVSSKWTGYGFVLRAAVGTPEEMSLHLQQIDDGPNYRWGRAGKGGGGVLYYYAGGKSFSHNGPEDVGDAPRGDVERCTNFGVKKDGGYRCIGPWRGVGRADLSEPLHDFGFAQFAQVNADEDAAPLYRSRSVLVSGADYVVVYDDVQEDTVEGRLSWFVGRDDAFPHIHQLRPGAPPVEADLKPESSPYHRDPDILPTRGRYYDGRGSFLTLVSHRGDVSATATEYGCLVRRPGGTDYVLRTGTPAAFTVGDGVTFRGAAGIVRQADDGRYEAALFQGARVGVPGLTLEIVGERAGASLRTDGDGFAGEVHAPAGGVLRLRPESGGRAAGADHKPYLDGKQAKARAGGGGVEIELPPGKHRWQWTRGAVTPGTSRIVRTVNRSGGFTVFWEPSAGAVSYDLQTSTDGGQSWRTVAARVAGTSFAVQGAANGCKVHLRVTANGRTASSPPSDDYPVYVTDKAPPPPEGLRLERDGERVAVSWGEILGAGEYRLYRRGKGESRFRRVYSGPGRTFVDAEADERIVYEYQVTAVSDNGESGPSTLGDTDPARLIHWDPKPGEGFRRDTRSHENGYPEYNHWVEERMPTLDYPDADGEAKKDRP